MCILRGKTVFFRTFYICKEKLYIVPSMYIQILYLVKRIYVIFLQWLYREEIWDGVETRSIRTDKKNRIL